MDLRWLVVSWRGASGRHTKMKSTRGSEGSCRSVSPSAPFTPSGDWDALGRAGDVDRLRLCSLPRKLLGDTWRSWFAGTMRVEVESPALSDGAHVAEDCEFMLDDEVHPQSQGRCLLEPTCWPLALLVYCWAIKGGFVAGLRKRNHGIGVLPKTEQIFGISEPAMSIVMLGLRRMSSAKREEQMETGCGESKFYMVWWLAHERGRGSRRQRHLCGQGMTRFSV